MESASEIPAGNDALDEIAPSNQTAEKTPLIRLAPLWRNKRKDGSTFFTGATGDVRYFVFPNTKKKTDKEPDAVIMIGQRPPPEKKTTTEIIPL